MTENNQKWTLCVGTIFPGLFPGTLGVSCIQKYLGKTWDLEVDDLRRFALDKHHTIDDEPFGGGGGMVLKPNIVDEWASQPKNKARRKICMSPRGQVFTQQMAEDFIGTDLCILCPRYEGVDIRVLKYWNIEEVSIGDYILHGGDIAAMVIAETCARLLSVKAHSIQSDSLSDSYLLEHDQYTRPAKWSPKDLDGAAETVYTVPEVLISGHHAEVKKWRKDNSLKITEQNRPDLWQKYLEDNK